MPIQSNYSSPYTTGAGTASGPGAGSRSALSGTASSKARALSDDMRRYRAVKQLR